MPYCARIEPESALAQQLCANASSVPIKMYHDKFTRIYPVSNLKTIAMISSINFNVVITKYLEFSYFKNGLQTMMS